MISNFKLFACVLTLTALAFDAYCQSTGNNFVITRNYKQQAGANANNISQVDIQVEYIDALGRPAQKIKAGQSTTGTDLVQVYEFDSYGRVNSREYLPHAYNSNASYRWAQDDQYIFYNQNYAQLDAGSARAYTDNIMDVSSAGRVKAIVKPGDRSDTTLISYSTNTTGEVKWYTHSPNSNILLTVIQSGDYAAGKLYRIHTTDENGKVMIEFKDMLDRVVCRKVVANGTETLSTYYVYDDFGQLVAVLQPEYQTSGSIASSAFLFEYDARGRMVGKRIPGTGKINYVYDNFDRIVATQDSVQKIRAIWSWIKYDALDRVVMTGEKLSYTDRTTWQGYFDASQAHHEDKTNSTIGYTTVNTQPTPIAETDIRIIKYYDDYVNFPKSTSLDYSNTYTITAHAAPKTYPTGSKTRIVRGDASVSDFLTDVVYYDAEYREIQTNKDIYDVSTGAIERVSTKYRYDLAPVIDQLKTDHVLSGTLTNSFLKTYYYDHADRLISMKEKVTLGTISREVRSASYRYNLLGQLKQKWLGSDDGLGFRRRTDYTSNIRGWLVEGKTVYKQTASGSDLPFFGFGLDYANGVHFTNGNVSSAQWNGKDENSYTKGMNFTYDGANRLTGSTGINSYADLENGITYYLNGNIKTLSRSGASVDNLTYNYLGNRLTSLTDASGNNTGVKSGTSSYSYDANGNMTSDGNKGATILYNFMNLPQKVTIGSKVLLYDYDYTGVKRKYQTDTLNVKYAGPFEYRLSGTTNNFYRLQLEESQAVLRNNAIKFEYYLKDHQGNVRVVFDEAGKIIQKSDYYPFGLEIDRNNPLQTPAARNNINRYSFLGKETQIGSGYIDLARRFYDPTTGRFLQVDPVIEGQENQSTYQYGWNNPILRSDPNGDFPECCGELFDSVMGAGVALVDNATGVNFRENYSPNNPKAYNRGQDIGDLGSMALGAFLTSDGVANIGGGTTVVASSVTVEAASGGTATIVAAPTAAAGAGLIVKGTLELALGKVLFSKGADNYKNQKGRVNEDGNDKPTRNERAAAKKAKKSSDSRYGGGAEHKSNARQSTQQKHDKGRARNARDKGGEKADADRYRTQDSKKKKG